MMLCDERLCTGCMACYNICNMNAIKVVVNEKGFQYPKVNNLKCTSCGLCENVCPAIHTNQNYTENPKVFACWSKNSKTRRDSSSGGIFYEIASCMINSGGYVCGAAFDESFNVHHIIAQSMPELKQIQGSKYVQSDISATYKQVENLLKIDKTVLYSGTPCQIDGIKSYLHIKKVDCEKLYTCDLICHGIPSPKFWDDYKQNLQKKYKSILKSYDFRYKEPGWVVFSAYAMFKNGKVYLESTNKDKYLRAFLYDLIIRDNCQSCKYTNINRVGDITLADFWGYKNIEGYENDDKGISLAIVNTDKGRKLFELIKEDIVWVEKPISEAINGNRSLSKPWPANKKTEQFWADYFKKGYKYVARKYLVPVKQRKNLGQKVKNTLYFIRIMPNTIVLRIIGNNNYTKLKRFFRK